MLTLAAALALSLASAANAAVSDPGAAPLAAPSASAEVKSVSSAQVFADPPSSTLLSFPSATGSAILNPPSLDSAKSDAAKPDSARGFPVSGALPIAGFVLCGAAALFFAKKKQGVASKKMLQIIETHSMGGRRQIIVARIAGETVVLGSSEAGLTLLLARPGETVQQVDPELAAAAQVEPASAAEKRNWLGRLRLARTEDTQSDPSFEDLLAQDAAARNRSRPEQPAAIVEPALLRQPIDPDAESAEDQELRRKLSQGRAGRIA